jgi:hypothetical protein
MASMPIYPPRPFQPNRFASGPSAVKAANQLRRMQEARDQWPFPWVYPPAEAVPREPQGFVVCPATSAGITQVLQYSVPSGLQFDLHAIMFTCVTTGMAIAAFNPGDLLWTVNRNTPASGTVPLQGSPLPDLQSVALPYGSPVQGPIQLRKALNFAPTDIIRVLVTNVSFGSPGAPNYVVAQLFGYERPVD